MSRFTTLRAAMALAPLLAACGEEEAPRPSTEQDLTLSEVFGGGSSGSSGQAPRYEDCLTTCQRMIGGSCQVRTVEDLHETCSCDVRCEGDSSIINTAKRPIEK